MPHLPSSGPPRHVDRALRIVALLLGLAAARIPAQMALSCTQPTGVGSFRLEATGCAPNAEIFNFVTFAIATPTGSGPFFGLSIQDSATLVTELFSPLGTAPFHVTADAAGSYLWQFSAAPLVPSLQLPVDCVTVAFGPAGYGGQSPALHVTLDF